MSKAVVGYVQYEPTFGDIAGNLRTLEGLIRGAGKTDLLVLPELAATGYDFKSTSEVAGLSESFEDGLTRVLLDRLAAELSTTIVIGYAERDGTHYYNSCMLVTPDGRAGNYRKIHLFSREQKLFSPGQSVPEIIETPAGRIGMMICFDWFFPEVARILALRGAQILAHPSNLVLDYCQRAMYARCVENRVFSITANRIGTEDRSGGELTFTGGSQVLDPQGTTLVSAPKDKKHVATVSIDPALADDKHVTSTNDLFECRQTHLYKELVK